MNAAPTTETRGDADGVFLGTLNPRHLRALIELMRGVDVRRERLDAIAGCSNGPALVAELRRRGLHIPCDCSLASVDRDGKRCWPGLYWLTANDFRKLSDWLATKPLDDLAEP
ncbi:hypothetical protein LJR260_003686 [Variovorax paradoxus]|uniref:hypothetical protein n=1 Tax=Variovorax TaxID=34072 RepID=UPI0034E8CBDC